MMHPSKYSPEKWLDYLRKGDAELQQECRVDVFKASGKGGQKRNKTSNAVRLTLDDLSVTESGSRSKAENMNAAVRKLRLIIASDTRRGRGKESLTPAVPREIEAYANCAQLRLNPKNPVYPIFIGYLIDLYLAYNGRWPDIAGELKISPSQIRRFVERDPFLTKVLKELSNRNSAGR